MRMRILCLHWTRLCSCGLHKYLHKLDSLWLDRFLPSFGCGRLVKKSSFLNIAAAGYVLLLVLAVMFLLCAVRALDE